MARYIDDNPQNITKHQQKLAELIKFDRAHWVFPIQTHENKVVEITEEHQGMNIDKQTPNALYQTLLIQLVFVDV